ncbi:hypothetical protein KSS87_019592 [Heliosperma pusillum]|nr:hypothetical protein KSS87_014464 [Heliosperma pusillum]KAH9610012.1 hypothetical protein KSS87_019592 [Heliosperma pusillum]
MGILFCKTEELDKLMAAAVAVEIAIATVVTIAEILKNNGLAVEKNRHIVGQDRKLRQIDGSYSSGRNRHQRQ